MDTLIAIRDWLADYGIWSLLILATAKTLTGILISLQDGGFKWYKLGDTFKEGDFVKVAVFAILSVFQLDSVNDANLTAPIALYLTADLTGGLMRNLGRLFPTLWDKSPESVK